MRATRAHVGDIENVVTRKFALDTEIPNIRLRVFEVRGNHILACLRIYDERGRKGILGEVCNAAAAESRALHGGAESVRRRGHDVTQDVVEEHVVVDREAAADDGL